MGLLDELSILFARNVDLFRRGGCPRRTHHDSLIRLRPHVLIQDIGLSANQGARQTDKFQSWIVV
jgi:hypothetical protein